MTIETIRRDQIVSQNDDKVVREIAEEKNKTFSFCSHLIIFLLNTFNQKKIGVDLTVSNLFHLDKSQWKFDKEKTEH